MTISRRGFSSLLGAGSLAGMAKREALSETNIPLSHEARPEARPGKDWHKEPLIPTMEHDAAVRLALLDPDMKKALYTYLYNEQKTSLPTQIDPDIEVLRSFSRMAKLTFQRQRNVEHALHHLITPHRETPHGLMGMFQSFISDLVWNRELKK